MPQRTMQAVESIFYDNFIALIERPATTSTKDTKKATDQVSSVVKDTDKNVASKFYTTALQNLQLARLKRIPHYARLVAFTNLYQHVPLASTNATNGGATGHSTAGKSTVPQKSPNSRPQSATQDTSTPAKETTGVPPQEVVPPSHVSQVPQPPSHEPMTAGQSQAESNGTPQTTPRRKSNSSKSPKPTKKTLASNHSATNKNNDPEELAFQERVSAIVVTDYDAIEFTYQLDMARLVFSKLIGNDLFKNIIYTSSAAQKAFLYLFVPIIFKPDEPGIVSDFLEILEDEEDLLEAASLDANRISIYKALMGRDILEVVMSSLNDEISGDLGKKVSLEDQLFQLLDENVACDDPRLDGPPDDMCIVCQYQKTYKKVPKHFIAAYNKSMDEKRINGDSSCQQHLDYYRLLYFLSLSLRAYWSMLETRPLEEVRTFISRSFEVIKGTEDDTAGSVDKPPSGSTTEDDDVLSSFPGHFADHSTLSATAET